MFEKDNRPFEIIPFKNIEKYIKMDDIIIFNLEQ
jgi:hypothetical protein